MATTSTNRLFNNLLLFSLFGIALGFFGMLYEGVVYGPRFLEISTEQMLFWKGFFSTINPILYYAPTVHLATIAAVVLYFRTPKDNKVVKRQIGIASILQIISLALTFYIVTQIGFKHSFDHLDEYATQIPAKAILFNVLSFVRVVFAAGALGFIFKAYVRSNQSAQEQLKSIQLIMPLRVV
jgi:hypothetical protein